MIDDEDSVLLAVRGLAELTPDPERSAGRRARCRARLRPERRRHLTLGLALFGSLCVLYLAAIALDILRVQRVL
jgi:hypothetical protein